VSTCVHLWFSSARIRSRAAGLPQTRFAPQRQVGRRRPRKAKLLRPVGYGPITLSAKTAKNLALSRPGAGSWPGRGSPGILIANRRSPGRMTISLTPTLARELTHNEPPLGLRSRQDSPVGSEERYLWDNAEVAIVAQDRIHA